MLPDVSQPLTVSLCTYAQHGERREFAARVELPLCFHAMMYPLTQRERADAPWKHYGAGMRTFGQERSVDCLQC